MAQAGFVYGVTSIDGTHFPGALAQNAGSIEDLPMGSAFGAGRIHSMIIWSSDNLAWEVQIFGSHDGPSSDPNLDTFRGRWSFVAADAVQIGNLWYYYIDGLDITYVDVDLNQHVGPHVNVYELHVRLVNRSAGGKTAYGSGGHFRLTVHIEPMLGGS